MTTLSLRWMSLAAALFMLLPFLPAAAQPDSADVDSHLPTGHSPRGAVKRAILPGWGQIYNRQYYKLPFVYVGLGGIVAGAAYTHKFLELYNDGYQYLARRNRSLEGYEQYEEPYRHLLERSGLPADSLLSDQERSTLERQFLEQRSTLRRNRDLLIIGCGLYYGLTVLDAYVSAHLLHFDVDEDLSVSLHPDPLQPGLRATLRLFP